MVMVVSCESTGYNVLTNYRILYTYTLRNKHSHCDSFARDVPIYKPCGVSAFRSGSSRRHRVQAPRVPSEARVHHMLDLHLD